MKPPMRRRLLGLTTILILLVTLPVGSCAVFRYRERCWEKKVHRTEDGVLTFAQPFELGRGSPAYLLVHGYGDGPQVWERLAPELAARGGRVRALRLPGWGERSSVKQTVKREDWENAILRESAELSADGAAVIVVAHSLGGCLSTVLAQSGRLQADALVLYAPMFAISNARSPLLPVAVWHRIGSVFLPSTMVVESLFPDHSLRGMARPRTRRDPFVPLRIFDVLYEEMDTFAAQSPRLRIPVRLVLPSEDSVVDSERARRWFLDVEAPQKTLTVAAQTGHVLPLDLDPAAEADALVRWLSTLTLALPRPADTAD